MFDHIGRVPVNLEPGERFPEDAAVEQRAFRARVRREIAHAPLDGQQLPQPLDVAPRQRQLAEPRPLRPRAKTGLRMDRRRPVSGGEIWTGPLQGSGKGAARRSSGTSRVKTS